MMVLYVHTTIWFPNSSQNMTSFCSSEPLRFRVTGKQSVERLEPLVRKLFPTSVWCDDVEQPLDFVWETTCEKSHKEVHANAKVLSRLHNTQVIESKANLAFLQETMDIPTIETYVATDNADILPWLEQRFCRDADGSREWWVLKASHGNGGKDIWLVNQSNYRAICAEVSVKQEYVLQRYVLVYSFRVKEKLAINLSHIHPIDYTDMSTILVYSKGKSFIIDVIP